jgi:benzoate membrane transport protein
MRFSLFSSALVASLIGYGSTIALVLAAASALGATAAQTASYVFAICLAKAIGSAWLSFQTRVPVVLAWSTPGAALIAASEGVTLAQGIGAFVVAGGLIVLTGAVKPLGALVARIPDQIAAAMLGGVLLPFCLALAGATKAVPMLALPMILVFLLVRLRNPAFAVLAALATGVGLAFVLGQTGAVGGAVVLPHLGFVMPEFRASVVLGLGVPLYLVTMASQNLPGFAVLRAAGYSPPVRPALLITGGISTFFALFGAHTVSMAAITAAICLGDDTHPDKAQRWKVGLVYGAVWLCLGVFGALIIGVIAALPVPFVTALVGLALLAPLMGAVSGAFTAPDHRFAALVTLVVTASGLSVFGIGAAFWGLLAGLIVHGLESLARR